MSSLERAFIRAFEKKQQGEGRVAGDVAPTSAPRLHVPATDGEALAALERAESARDVTGVLESLPPDAVVRRLDPSGVSSVPHLRLIPTPVEESDAQRTMRRIDAAEPFGSYGAPVARFVTEAGPQAEIAPEETHRFQPDTAEEDAYRQQAAQNEAGPATVDRHAGRPSWELKTSANTEPAIVPAWQVSEVDWPAVSQSMVVSGALNELAWDLVYESRTGRRVFAVSSLRSGEGRTSLVLALAQRLLELGVEVAVMDADVAPRGADPQPTGLAQQLGLAPERGWEHYLSGGEPLAEVLIEVEGTGLWVLPWSERSGTSELAQNRPLVEETLATLRRQRQLVLIDAPAIATAVLGRPAEAFGPLRPDAVLLVRGVHASSTSEVEAAARTLRGAGLFTWGVLENFVRS